MHDNDQASAHTADSPLGFSSFATDGLPAAAAQAIWRESIAPMFESRPLDPDGFRGAIDACLFDGLVLAHAQAGAQEFRRDRRMQHRDGIDHLLVQCYRTGGYAGEHHGRTVRVGPGDTGILDLGVPTHTHDTAFESFTLVVPRDRLQALVGTIDCGGLVIPGQAALGRILASHLAATWRSLPALCARDAPFAAQAVLGVLAACIAAHRGDRADAVTAEPATALAIRDFRATAGGAETRFVAFGPGRTTLEGSLTMVHTGTDSKAWLDLGFAQSGASAPAGDLIINGRIDMSGSAGDSSIGNYSSGTLELNGGVDMSPITADGYHDIFNAGPGRTVIAGPIAGVDAIGAYAGTLTLGAATDVSEVTWFDVDGGATLDASALPGGLSLSGTQVVTAWGHISSVRPWCGCLHRPRGRSPPRASSVWHGGGAAPWPGADAKPPEPGHRRCRRSPALPPRPGAGRAPGSGPGRAPGRPWPDAASSGARRTARRPESPAVLDGPRSSRRPARPRATPTRRCHAGIERSAPRADL